MKKQFTELIGVFSALIFLLLLNPTNLSAQCEAGETEYTLSLYVGGSFATERAVEVVPANGDPAFFLVDCGSYPQSPLGEYVDFDFCVVIGEEYTINFIDNFGDGWNMPDGPDDPASWILSNGPIEVQSGTNPTDGACCNVTDCANADVEDSFTFSAAEPADCTQPDVEYFVTENCENLTYDITVDLNDFGADDNGIPVQNLTVLVTDDSDDYDVPDPQITFPFFTEGTTDQAVVSGVPFGVTVTLNTVVGLNSICNLLESVTNANICPPPNDECSEALLAECGVEYSGNTANAAPLPEALVGTTCGTSINGGGVWYEFTAPFNAIITANTFGSNYDTKLFAFSSDDCLAFECIAGNDDSGSLQSQISFGVNADETVYFFVSGFFGATGDYSFIVNCEELLCTNPTIVFEAQDLEGNPIEGCQEVGEQYQLAVTLTDVPVDDPNADYTVSAGGLSEAAVVVDQQVVLGPYNAGTNLTINALGNQDDLCESSESYTSEICPPENNLPCDATVIECAGTYLGTNIGADPAADGEFCDGSSLSGIVYYQFTNSEPNNIFFRWETCNEGTDFDTDSHLFDGPCDDLSCRPVLGQTPGGFNVGYTDGNSACSFVAWATGNEVILGPGETVFLGIDGFVSSSGVFELTIECESILCSSPSVTATAVEVGTETEIVDCQVFGEQYEVIVSIDGGSGNDDYTLTVGGSTPIADATSGSTYTFGPFDAGTNQAVSVAGNTDANCSASASAGTVICPPTNDLCADRIPVGCGDLVGGTTLGATADGTPFCGTSNTGAPGVWYSLTVPGDANVELDLCGSGYDTKIQVFEGSCEELVCVGGNDDQGILNCSASGLHSFLAFEATADTEYLILVYGFGSAAGNYQMQVSCQDIACSPTADAVAVADAEGNPIEDCVPQTGEYYVSVALAGGSDQDYNVSVNGSDPVVAGFEGTVVVGPVPALQTANIVVTGVDNILCSTSAEVNATVCPPDNDDACNALFVPADGSVGTYSTQFATVQDGEPIPPAGSSNFQNTCQSNDGWCSFQLSLLSTVWYTTTVPPSGRLTISTCGPDTDFDTQIAVYSGDCSDFGSLELLGANDDQAGGCPDFFSAATLSLCAEPGSTLLIQIDAGDTFGGDIFNLSITEEEDNSACACVAPELDDEFLNFTLLEPTLDCTDPENGFYTMTVLAQDDLGSSEGWDITYTIDGGAPVEAFVPAGGSIDLPEEIPLGGNIQVTFAFSDPACAGTIPPFPVTIGGIFFFDGACAPDCAGVPGGGADPGTACVTENEEPGIYDANCECQATPANDLPCNAEVLECGVQTSGSTVAASTSGDFCDFSSLSGAVWYQYTATANGSVTIETCLEGTDFDTDSHVFTGDCENLVCYSEYGGGGYVDGNSACAFSAWATGGTFPVESGVTYFIMIDGFGSLSGNFELLLTCELDDESSLDGSVDWNSSCGERAASVEIYEAGSSNLLNSYDVTVDAQGDFSVAISETGSVDVYVKVDGYLQKVAAGVELVSGSNAVDFGSITAGDLTGNNEIGIGDFSAFSASYGLADGDAAFNPLADINCNLIVDIPDFSTFSANYGDAGDAPAE